MKRLALTAAFALLAATPAYAGPVDGVWSGESQMRMGPQMLTLDIKANGKTLTGTLKQAEGQPAPIEGGKVDGSKFWFEKMFDMQGRHVVFKWSGEVNGDSMMLTREVVTPEGSGAQGAAPVMHVPMTRVK